MLKQLHLKNWRSLRDVTIDFTPITVFIGANSSGKTNIIDALKFRRYVGQNGLIKAISRWRFYNEVFTQNSADKIALLSMIYSFSTETNFKSTVHFEKKSDFLTTHGRKPINEDFENHIAHRWQILDEGFSPDIYQSRKTDQPLDLIDGQAENMLAILDYMRDPQVAPQVYQAFSEDLHDILPHVDAVDIHVNSQEYQLKIQERQREALTISAGTARVAAMLTALHILDIPPEHPSETPLPDPGLVIIEEPDAALNPGVLEKLVNVMRRFTEGDNPRQIILTTHNPTFLNYFKPEEVRVVERNEEGITQVYPVPHDILDDMEVITSMGDMWMTRSIGGLPE